MGDTQKVSGPLCWTGEWTSVPSFLDVLSCTHQSCYAIADRDRTP